MTGKNSCRSEAEIDGQRYVVLSRPDGNSTSFIPVELAERPIPDWSEHLSDLNRRLLKQTDIHKDLRRIAWVLKRNYQEISIGRALSHIGHNRLKYDWWAHLSEILDVFEYFNDLGIDAWPGNLDPADLDAESAKQHRRFLDADSDMRIYTIALLEPDEALSALDEWGHAVSGWTNGAYVRIGRAPERRRLRNAGRKTWRKQASSEEITTLYLAYRLRHPNKTKNDIAAMMQANELEGRFLNKDGEPGKPESLAKRFPSKKSLSS